MQKGRAKRVTEGIVTWNQLDFSSFKSKLLALKILRKNHSKRAEVLKIDYTVKLQTLQPKTVLKYFFFLEKKKTIVISQTWKS